MYVEVYRNLHKNCFSIRSKGKVIAHRNKLVIKNAKFVIQPAGRKRVLETKRKNVHALVRGNLSSFKGLADKPLGPEISYNPYRFDYFYNKDNLEPIYDASIVVFNNNKVNLLED